MLNGNTFSQWLNDNIIPIIIAVMVISVLWAAATKKVRDFALGVGLGLAGLAFAMAAANWQSLGQWVRGVFGG